EGTRAPDRGKRTERAAGEAEQPAFEQSRAHDDDRIRAERARNGYLMLPLRRAHEQHRSEIHHQHEHEDEACGAKHDERGPNPRDDVRLQSNRIQLQTAAVEIAHIDGATDSVNRGGHCAGRCAVTSADERSESAILRIRLAEMYF